MEAKSIGTTVGTKRLEDLAPNEEFRKICNIKVEYLCQVFYMAIILFKLDSFRSMDSGILPTITERHINRCINLVRGGGKFRHKKDKQGNIIPHLPNIARLLESYRIYSCMFAHVKFPKKVKSSERPLEYAATEFFTNIRVQISEHYEKYQRSYIRTRLEDYLVLNGLAKLENMQYRAISYHVQWAINGNCVVKEFTSKHVPTVLREMLMPHLQILATTIHSGLPQKLHNLTEFSLKKESNIPEFTVYMHMMSQYLRVKGVASFAALPNPQMKRRNFMFDKRFLCSIYNEWKGTKINIKDFEADYTEYYHKMFNTHKLYPKQYAVIAPKSYSTNGYTVSVIFSPDEPGSKKKGKQSNSPGKKKGKKKEDIPRVNHPIEGNLKHGLYDSGGLRASKPQLGKYHYTSIDPGNNGMLTCVTYDGKYGETYTITKGYYNEISHITRNTRKIKKITDDSEIATLCNKHLSYESLKGANVVLYISYIAVRLVNWDALWKHEFQKELAVIKYDTFIHKKMAVAKICRIIRSKNKSKKPSVVIFGKGNGSMTISNTRGTSSHGPIKRIAHALSLLVPVILTDEYLTSQLCNLCNSKLIYPIVEFRKKNRRILRKQFGIRPKTRAEFLSITKSAAFEKYKVVKKKEAYKVCYCSCKNHHNKDGKKRNILWKRDENSGRCIFKVAIGKITGKPVEEFTRKVLKY